VSRAARPALTVLLTLLVAGCSGGQEGTGSASADAARAALASVEYQTFAAEARKLHEQGNLRGALQQATRALSVAPLAREPWDAIQRLYTEIGRSDEALQFFTIAARKFSTSPYAHLYLGGAEYRMGNWESALAAYDEALRLDPTQSEAHFQRAVILQGQASFEEALAAYRRSLELEPRSTTAAARVARMQRVTGDYEGAMATVERALAVVPGSPELLYTRGQILFHGGEVEAAEAAFRGALDRNPDHGGAHHDLARLLMRTGREDEGRRHERTAQRLTEISETRDALGAMLGARAGDPLVPILMAELELTAGNHGEALNWLGRAETQGGPAGRIAAARAEAWFGAGDLVRGEAELTVLTGKTDARSALARAAGLAARGRTAQAVPFLERAAKEGPQEREFLRRIADLYEAAGEADRAEELLERAESAPRIGTGSTHASDG
jgi:tetratricopeptide (TPR) repeat protein